MSFKNKYDPKEVEKEILDFWNKNEIYKFDKNTNKKIFSIDTPLQLFLVKCILDMLFLILNLTL